MMGWLRDVSKGDNLFLFWKLFRWRERTGCRLLRQILTFFLGRIAHRHGGYIGNGAVFKAVPILPHGLHGVFISRYAKIGASCWIYQNVTIGEADRSAPEIGDHCLSPAPMPGLESLSTGFTATGGPPARVRHCGRFCPSGPG